MRKAERSATNQRSRTAMLKGPAANRRLRVVALAPRLRPCRLQLADFLELNTQSVPERAFWAKFIKQRFRLIEGIRRHILGLEQITEAALNLGFGKQSEDLQALIASGTTRGPWQSAGQIETGGNHRRRHQAA